MSQLLEASDSDLSLELSDGSSLSSDSEHSVDSKRTPKKDTKKYCVCRQGYNGKEFMIECEYCQEWFHGNCVGVEPNTVKEHFFCPSCQKKKKKGRGKKLIGKIPNKTPRKKNGKSSKSKSTTKPVPILTLLPPTPPKPKPKAKPPPPPPPPTPSLNDDDDEEEDLDDICPVCDTECTCNSGSVSNVKPAPVDEPAIEEKIKEIVIEDAIESPLVVERVGINEPTTKKKKSKSTKKKSVKRGKSTALLANIILQKPLSDSEEHSEEHSEDVVVDDLDDLLDTMSPLSSSSPFVDGNGHEEEEFFTVDDDDDDDDEDALSLSYPESRTSSVHIDSGDDEDIEDEETNAIIHEFDDDSDDSDDEEEDEEEQDEEEEEEEEEEDSVSDMEDVDLFVEDEDEDEEDIHNYYYHQEQTLNSRWSSSDEEEEEEEFDYTSHLEYPTDDDDGMYESDDEQTSSVNPLLPLLDSDGNLYNNFASAFLQATDPIATDGTNTPSMDENPLSIFDLANALNILSAAETTNNDTELLRRPSLPSSAVSAAHGPSQEFTSEALGAVLSALEDTESEYEDKHIQTAPPSPTDFNIQQQIIDMLKSATEQHKEPILPQTPQKKTASRQILPKPVASGSSTASSSHHPLLEQQIQEALAESIEAARKRNFSDTSFKGKKRRISRSNSLIVPDATEEVSMDDLVDTSQLSTTTTSPEDDPYSRDLSRWQRIPIGAFRLMRSKNKLWLER